MSVAKPERLVRQTFDKIDYAHVSNICVSEGTAQQLYFISG